MMLRLQEEEDQKKEPRRDDRRRRWKTFGMALTCRTPFTLHSNSKSSSIRIPTACYCGQKRGVWRGGWGVFGQDSTRGVGEAGILRYLPSRSDKTWMPRWMLMLIPCVVPGQFSPRAAYKKFTNIYIYIL